MWIGSERLSFHHVGVACEMIESEEAAFAHLGYVREGDPFEDEAQGVRGLFLVGGGPRIELLADVEGSHTIRPWLQRRIKFYHFAYETSAFSADLEVAISQGGVIVRDPMISAYFKQRIAFVMLPTRILVEFVEKRNLRDG